MALEEIIGKREQKQGDEASKRVSVKANTKDVKSNYARMKTLACINDYVNKEGKIDYKKNEEGKVVGLPNINKKNSELARLIGKYYQVFENCKNNREIMGVPIPSYAAKFTDELSVIKNVDESYLYGELLSYCNKKGWISEGNAGFEKLTADGKLIFNPAHDCGLVNYIDNAIESLKKEASKKEMKKIKQGLREGNVKRLLSACDYHSKQLEKEYSLKDEEVITEYYSEGIAKAANNMYDTIDREAGDRGLDKTGKEARTSSKFISDLIKMRLIDKKYVKKYLDKEIREELNKDKENGILLLEHQAARLDAKE